MTTNRNRPEAGEHTSNGRQKPTRIDNQNIQLERYIDKAISQILEKARAALNGGRNQSLNEASYAFGQLLNYISRDRAEADLAATGKFIGLDEIESRSTIKSGLDAGEKNPRDLSHIGGHDRVRTQSRHWPTKEWKQIEQPAPIDPNDQRKRKYANRLWQQARPATGTLAALYLKSRGLSGPYGDNIRYLASHKHGNSETFWPICLFGLSHEPGGDTVALQRVYLRRDGTDKAPVKPTKMSLGPIRGTAVWCGESAETLVIVEGPEDGLTCHKAGYFTAVACGAFNMKNLTIPAFVRKIIIGADHGEAGEIAAQKAAQTYLRQSYEVRVAFPPVGYDWNSYWLANGREVTA